MQFRALTGTLAALTAALWIGAIGCLVGSIDHEVQTVVTLFVEIAAGTVGVAWALFWLAERIRRRSVGSIYRAASARGRAAIRHIPQQSVPRDSDVPTERIDRESLAAVRKDQAYWLAAADLAEVLLTPRSDDLN